MKPRTSGNKVIQIQGKAFVKCTWRGSQNQLSGSRFMGGKDTQKLRNLFKIMQHVWHVYISLAFSHAGDRTDRTVCSGCCKWQMTNQIHPRVNNVMCMDGMQLMVSITRTIFVFPNRSTNVKLRACMACVKMMKTIGNLTYEHLQAQARFETTSEIRTIICSTLQQCRCEMVSGHFHLPIPSNSSRDKVSSKSKVTNFTLASGLSGYFWQ